MTRLWKAFGRGVAQAGITTLVLLWFAGIGWWWTGPDSNEVAIYSATCALDGSQAIQILPESLAIEEQPF